MPRFDDDEPDDRDADRPRRRRDEDDDEYDDRPRRKKSGLSPVLIVLIVLAACGICCVPVGIALLLPAVQKVREAAARTKDANNLKEVGLGMHNYHDAQNRLPGPFADRPDNTPNTGLSFRVSLLPYLIKSPVSADQFNPREAWDGPTNRPLADVSVPAYSSPFDPPGTAATGYRAFVGGGALFEEDGKPAKMAAVSDGLSNTLMLATAEEQVKWPEPRELKYSPTAPLPKLGHPGLRTGFNVLMADGSVRFLRTGVSEQALRAAITRAGGENVPLE